MSSYLQHSFYSFSPSATFSCHCHTAGLPLCCSCYGESFHLPTDFAFFKFLCYLHLLLLAFPLAAFYVSKLLRMKYNFGFAQRFNFNRFLVEKLPTNYVCTFCIVVTLVVSKMETKRYVPDAEFLLGEVLRRESGAELNLVPVN